MKAHNSSPKLLNTLFVTLLAFFSSLYPISVQAQLMSPPMPLADIINHSPTIALARVSKFIADNKPATDVAPQRTFWNNSTAIDSDDNIVPSGTYFFNVWMIVRGQNDKVLQLHLPALSRLDYGFASFNIKLGDYCILFLTKNVDGQIVPFEPGIPLVELSQTSAPMVEANAKDVSTETLDLILRSISNPLVRQANTALLRDVNNPTVLERLSPFINDPNDSVRDNVLYCMAVNQVVSAIPKIAQLQRKKAEQGSGTSCVTALQFYHNPQAVPLLNPLLFQNDEYIRINSVLALQKTADASSIPYLVLALHDPDPQNVVPYTAYLTLHRIIAKLPKDANDFDYVKPIPQKDLMPINVWWDDELMGIHFHPTVQVSGRNAKQAIENVEQLNMAMFNPNPSARLKSVKTLTSLANRTSIPFLVLALQDPDIDVAYNAYKILHRLVPALGPAEDAAAFNVKRMAVSQPVYDWWRDELLGKHLPE